jgi:hypothetical protein
MIAKSLPLLVPHHSNGLLDSRVCRRLVVNEYGDFAFPVAVPA